MTTFRTPLDRLLRFFSLIESTVDGFHGRLSKYGIDGIFQDKELLAIHTEAHATVLSAEVLPKSTAERDRFLPSHEGRAWLEGNGIASAYADLFMAPHDPPDEEKPQDLFTDYDSRIFIEAIGLAVGSERELQEVLQSKKLLDCVPYAGQYFKLYHDHWHLSPNERGEWLARLEARASLSPVYAREAKLKRVAILQPHNLELLWSIFGYRSFISVKTAVRQLKQQTLARFAEFLTSAQAMNDPKGLHAFAATIERLERLVPDQPSDQDRGHLRQGALFVSNKTLRSRKDLLDAGELIAEKNPQTTGSWPTPS